MQNAVITKAPMSAVEMSHLLVREHAQFLGAPTKGLPAVDATAGNGHDTLFLANLLGPQGHVLAFDVQEQALNRVRQSLHHRDPEAAATQATVELVHAGHERLEETLANRDLAGEGIAIAMFNLGYLPHGDKSIVTHSKTTLPALRQALRLLRPHGLITLVLYRGHPGGTEEADAVIEEASTWEPKLYQTGHWRNLGRFRTPPPELLAIHRRG